VAAISRLLKIKVSFAKEPYKRDIHTHIHLIFETYIHILICINYHHSIHYGVAMISRLLKIEVSFAKEPYKKRDIHT